MEAPDKVFAITGNKIASLLITNEAFQFSSKSFGRPDEFTEAWGKKLSLATKVEVKYSKIKSVSKEIPGKEVRIKKYKGFPPEIVFSFRDPRDYDILATYLENRLFFRRTEEKLSPLKASTPYLFGLLFTLVSAIFCYYELVEIKNAGGLENVNAEETSGKVQLFNKFIVLLGDKGIIVVGGLISLYIIYRAWKRYTNPPTQEKFLPQNI